MQILWTSDAEYALKKARADKYIMRITNQKFLDLLNGLIDLTVQDLVALDRTRIETMITIHVHQRYVWCFHVNLSNFLDVVITSIFLVFLLLRMKYAYGSAVGTMVMLAFYFTPLILIGECQNQHLADCKLVLE